MANRLAALAASRFDGAQIEHLTRVIPLVDGRGCRVETFVALEADERRLKDVGEDLGDFRLADAGFALQQERFAEFQGQTGSSPDRARRRSAGRADRAPARRRW